jgi:hypothetical protein
LSQIFLADKPVVMPGQDAGNQILLEDAELVGLD